MTIASEELARSPAWYPMALDFARDAILFLRMDEADYRASSFLDERVVTHGQEIWLPFADVERAMAKPVVSRPLHFIFHMGHVGSTLLSRLLDETGAVLSLREPLPLRAISDAVDGAVPDVHRRTETLLRLWERGFPDTKTVVLKATSSTERIGPKLLAMRPDAKAVMLNVTAEAFLATVLAASNSAADLNALGPERMHRLGKFGVTAPRPTTLGELAAMSWLAERMTQAEIQRDCGARAMPVDFDMLLETPELALTQILAHLEIVQSRDQIASIARSRAMSRYSKAPEHEYSPALRRKHLNEARAAYGAEIRAALDWLTKVAPPHTDAAALI